LRGDSPISLRLTVPSPFSSALHNALSNLSVCLLLDFQDFICKLLFASSLFLVGIQAPWNRGRRGRGTALFSRRDRAVAVLGVSFSEFSFYSAHTGQPFQPPLVFGGGNPWPERPLSPPPLRFRASSLALSPAVGSRHRWRRRWKRCAVAEGGRTPPYGDSTRTILGEPRDFSDSGVGF
jgi:hypothetical protein